MPEHDRATDLDATADQRLQECFPLRYLRDAVNESRSRNAPRKDLQLGFQQVKKDQLRRTLDATFAEIAQC